MSIHGDGDSDSDNDNDGIPDDSYSDEQEDEGGDGMKPLLQATTASMKEKEFFI